jgi:transcriptional regulator with XRE-family HTH domain
MERCTKPATASPGSKVCRIRKLINLQFIRPAYVRRQVQLDRTARLVKRLKTYCEENKILQKTLASQLRLSPQGVFEIFKGNNSPSAETVLHIVEIIEPEFMKTIVDPPKPPRQAAGTNPNLPRNLEEARSRIESLNQQIAQLKGGAAPLPGKPAAPASPKAKAQPMGDPGSDPVYPPARTAGGDQPNTNEMESGPAAPSKALPVTANTPVLIQKILDVTTLDDLRLLLNNPAHTPTQQACIYSEIRKRRDLVANRFQ